MAVPMPAAAALPGLIGGVMIGCAAALLLLGAGRIAGVSGLAARTAGLALSGTPWRVAAAFVVGLPLGAAAMAALVGPVLPRFPASAAVLLTGGLAVGFGTRLGSGCTSGHGVCGVSRLSRRSLAATATFIAAGVATVAAMNRLGIPW